MRPNGGKDNPLRKKYLKLCAAEVFLLINSSLETTRSTSTQCGESVLLQELKVKISELEETLKLTRTQLDKVEIELEMQKKAVANFTQVNIVKHL